MKRKLLLMLSLVSMLALIIPCCFFFGLAGKLGLMYIPKYIKSDTDNKFVNPQNVASLDIYAYNSYLQVKNSLKYCNNITFFAIDVDDKTLKSIDCLNCFPKVVSVGIRGKSNDWSGLSDCIKLKSLDITESNFSDLKYLNNLGYLEYLEIRTDSELIYSNELDLNSLDWLILAAPIIDISYFDTAVNMTKFTIKAENVKNTGLLKKFVNLKSLMFMETIINGDDLNAISKLSSIECLNFNKCKFCMNEEEVNKYLKDYFERNTEVKLNECIFE